MASTSDFFAALVDDAAFFPPGELPMEQAVPAHRAHLRSAYGAIVGSFVAPDSQLPTLAKLTTETDEPVRTSVVVTGGAGAIESAVRWTEQNAGVELVGLEVSVRNDADLTHNTMRITTAVRDCVDDKVNVWIELPRLEEPEPPASWLSSLDEIAASGHRGKIRTGGLDADAFATSHVLATSIEAMLDRELTFKCTAGLHNAVRHLAGDGFEHHGFLNMLLAVRASLDGADVSEVAAILDEHDGAALADRLQALPDGAATSTRAMFASFGSCSIMEPVEDLRSLGLFLEGDES